MFVGGCLCLNDFVHVTLEGYPFESNFECTQSYYYECVYIPANVQGREMSISVQWLYFDLARQSCALLLTCICFEGSVMLYSVI